MNKQLENDMQREKKRVDSNPRSRIDVSPTRTRAIRSKGASQCKAQAELGVNLCRVTGVSPRQRH